MITRYVALKRIQRCGRRLSMAWHDAIRLTAPGVPGMVPGYAAAYPPVSDLPDWHPSRRARFNPW